VTFDVNHQSIPKKGAETNGYGELSPKLNTMSCSVEKFVFGDVLALNSVWPVFPF